MLGSAHAAATCSANRNHGPDLPRLRRHPGTGQSAVADARPVTASERRGTRRRSADVLAMSHLRLSPSVNRGGIRTLASAQQEEHLAALVRIEGAEVELGLTIVAQQL